jgi:hypothetical protein
MQTKKVTFIRIPKNASTSIYDFFGCTNTVIDYALMEIFTSKEDVYKKFFAPSHCRINTAVEYLGDKILSLPTLAVIRNPYDRMVSMYHFSMRMDLGKMYDKTIDNFLQFCELMEEQAQDKTFFPAWTQKSYIEIDGKLVDKLRFENIDKDFESFLEKYNLTNFYKTHKRILERKNSTNHDDYKKYLCSSSKSIIERIWGEDFYIKTNI